MFIEKVSDYNTRKNSKERMCHVFFWMQKQIEKITVSNGKEVKKRRTNNENKLLERAAGKYAAEPASVVSDCP